MGRVLLLALSLISLSESLRKCKYITTVPCQSKKRGRFSWPTHLNDDALCQQTLLLGSHDEVVRLVLVVHDVLQLDARRVIEIVEELLVEDERHAGDLVDARLSLRVPVHEVGRDRDGQLAAELLTAEA